MEGGDKMAARTGGGQARAKEKEEVNQARSRLCGASDPNNVSFPN